MAPDMRIAGIFSSPEPEPASGRSNEFVVLVHTGDKPVSLRGWSLTSRKPDQQHHFRYLFPRFLANGDPWEVEPGGMVFIHTGRGTGGFTGGGQEPRQFQFYQHRSVCIWQEGDTACLYNQSGHLVDLFHLPEVRRPA